MSEGIRGLEVPAVKRWLAANVDSADGELSFELVTAGGSNLTYRVENSDGQKWALRRPPERARLATAHDMSREHRIITGVGRTSVPVPRALGLCPGPVP